MPGIIEFPLCFIIYISS